jgi:hypothetical protein
MTGKDGSSTIPTSGSFPEEPLRIFPRGTFAHIHEHRWDIPEGPSSDEDEDEDDNNNDNRDNNGNGGKDSKSPGVNRKVGDKRPRSDEDEDDDDNDNRDNPFPVLSCEERSRYIEKQRVLIRSLIIEFGLEREVHYTTFNPPFGFVYEGALADILELDHVMYEIIYEREKREVYYFYVRNFPGGTMIPVRADQYDMAEPPSSDDDEDKDDDNNDNRDNNGNGGKDTKSPDVNRKVGDKRPPDTDATLPLPTSKLAKQADNLQAHLNVFPNGHRGPSGDRLLAEMELELLKRGTE